MLISILAEKIHGISTERANKQGMPLTEVLAEFVKDVEKSKDQLVDAPEGGQSVSIQETQDIFSISVSNPFTMTAGTGVTLSNDGASFDGSSAVSQTFSIGQDVDCRDIVWIGDDAENWI